MSFENVVFDVETDGLIPELTKVHSLVLKDLDTGEVMSGADQPGYVPVTEALDVLQKADLIVGHNIITFDVPALQKVYPNFAPSGVVRDTHVLSRLIWPDLEVDDWRWIKKYERRGRSMTWFLKKFRAGSHKLDAWGARLGIKKLEFGKTTDWKEWSKSMQVYCERDVDVNERLWKKILSKKPSKESVELEHRFQDIILLQEQTGVRFDDTAAHELYAELSEQRAELAEKLRKDYPPRKIPMKTPDHYAYRGGKYETKKVAIEKARKYAKANGRTIKSEVAKIEEGPPRVKLIPFNPNSHKQVADRIIERFGWKPKKFNKDGTPSLDESVINSLKFPGIEDIKMYMLISKRIGQVAEGRQAWLKHVTDEKRIHGRVITNGTFTGRCAHRSPNLGQVPRIDKPYGPECRSLFIASPGYWLLGWDASGLELRGLAHFLAPYDGGAMAERVVDGDIHSYNQNLMPDLLVSRDAAKTFIYAFIYGAGDEKLGKIVRKYYALEGRTPPKGKLRKLGHNLRTRFKREVPGFESLMAKVKQAANRGWVKGLDGRIMEVRSEHSTLNTIIQSAGGVLMKMALVHYHAKLVHKMRLKYGDDWRYVLNVHDEWQQEVRSKELAEELGEVCNESLREAGKSFGFRCRLDGEYKIGENWSDTH